MSNAKRKFIESHWLTFAMKGAISVVAGLCLMFAPKSDIHLMAHITGWTMFGLAMIEILNVVERKVKSHNWGFPLLLGLIELGIAIALLFTLDPNASDEQLFAVRISLLSGYVLFASVVTIVMGFVSFDNMTDRFMWIVNGVVGSIIAFMMFGGTSLGAAAHIELFGTYLMVNGLTDLFFGIHSKEEATPIAPAHKKASAKRGKK